MKFKTTGILAAILAVLVVIVYFGDVKRSEKKKQVEEKESKLVQVEPDSIREIILKPSGIHLVKQKDQWEILEPVYTRADRSAVQGIVSTFRWAKRYRTVASDSVNFADYGLAPPRYDIILVHSAGKDTIHLGDKTPTGTYVFARMNHENKVFTTTTSLLNHAKKTLYNLRDKTVLPFEKDQVNEIVLKNRHGRFDIVKEGGNWKLKKPIETDAEKFKVDDILGRLRNARAKKFVEEQAKAKDLAKYGLTHPTVRVDLTVGADKAKKTLLIGKRKGTQYYAKDENRPPVFLVDSLLVHNLQVSAFDLRKKKLFYFLTTQVDSLELIYPASHFVCAKDTNGTWVVLEPERRKAKAWRMSGIAGTVVGVRAKKFISEKPTNLAKYHLDKPLVEVKLYGNGKLLADLRLGSSTKDGIYAMAGDKGPIVLVNKNTLDKLKFTLDDIAEPKPEPVAAADTAKADTAKAGTSSGQ